MKLDLIITAQKIITLEPEYPEAKSVGVLNGKIVGFDDDLEGLSAEKVYNFESSTLTPGLIDAHCHTSWWGLSLSAIDLTDASGLDEVYRLIEEDVALKEDDPHAWIHATGFNQTNNGGQTPDIEILDKLTGDRPLYIRHASGHASITNTATLKLIGALEEGFEDPVGGVIERTADNKPTGLIEEAAQELVQALLLPYSRTKLVDALEAATSRYAMQGITSFTEAGVGGGWIGHSPIEVAAYQQAEQEGKLHARAQLMPTLDTLNKISAHKDDFQGLNSGRGLDLGIRYGFGNDNLQLGHVKVFLDGSLLGETAAVTEPFCGSAHTTGYLLDDPAVFRDLVHASYSAGWPLALHAIGDAAIDLALDLISEVQSKFGFIKNGDEVVPNRIEHFAIVRPDQLAKAATLNIAVSPQASFIGPFGDQMIESVGPDRESLLYRGRTIIDAGITLAGSSDLPVTDNNLRRGMQSAVSRLTNSGKALAAGEAITQLEALKTHTEWAAKATGQLATKGTLKRGKFADFAVFSADPTSSEDITKIDIDATFLGGEPTYLRKD